MRNILFWLITASYAAHIMEEYILNWKKWVVEMAKIKISWIDFFVTNFTVIIVEICFSMIGWNYPVISLCLPALLLINSLFFHILPTIIKHRFSPGIITSVVLFIPLSLFTYYRAFETYKITTETFIMSFLGGIFFMSYPIFLQKIKKLQKCKN